MASELLDLDDECDLFYIGFRERIVVLEVCDSIEIINI